MASDPISGNCIICLLFTYFSAEEAPFLICLLQTLFSDPGGPLSLFRKCGREEFPCLVRLPPFITTALELTIRLLHAHLLLFRFQVLTGRLT